MTRKTILLTLGVLLLGGIIYMLSIGDDTVTQPRGELPIDQVVPTAENDQLQEALDTDTDTAMNIPTRTIYALGDSLTAGYRLPLADSYPSQLEAMLQGDGYDYVLVNGGRSGDTSAQLLSRLDWIIEDATQGDIAIIVIGSNDGFQSLPLDQLEANIETIIQRLEDKGVQVVLGGMQIPTNLAPGYRADFAAIYPRLSDQYDLPLIPFFLENVAADRTLNLPDGIHPTAEGYEIIARQTMDFLVENELIVK